MSILNTGTLTVVVSTIVTSVMILLTGNSVADSTDAGSKIKKMTKESVSENSLVTKQGSILKQGKAEKAVTSKSLPPPGPFKVLGSKQGISGKPPKEPIAPKAPSSPVVKKIPTSKASVPAKPDQTAAVPELKEKAPISPVPPVSKMMTKKLSDPGMSEGKPDIPLAPTTSAVAPVMKQSAPAILKKSWKNIQAPTQQPPELKVPQSPQGLAKPPLMNEVNKPIWQRQSRKAPESIDKRAPQLKGMMINKPSPRKMPQNGAMNRPMPNMISGQQYMYVPMPMYPSNGYPQMPRYGGYNYMPTPNNMMPRERARQPKMNGNPLVQPVAPKKDLSR